MRWTLVALALFLPVTSIQAGSPDDAKRKAELAWARRIVTDFFEQLPPLLTEMGCIVWLRLGAC